MNYKNNDKINAKLNLNFSIVVSGTEMETSYGIKEKSSFLELLNLNLDLGIVYDLNINFFYLLPWNNKTIVIENVIFENKQISSTSELVMFIENQAKSLDNKKGKPEYNNINVALLYRGTKDASDFLPYKYYIGDGKGFTIG